MMEAAMRLVGEDPDQLFRVLLQSRQQADDGLNNHNALANIPNDFSTTQNSRPPFTTLESQKMVTEW